LFFSAIALLLVGTVFYQLGYREVGEITVLLGTLTFTISIFLMIKQKKRPDDQARAILFKNQIRKKRNYEFTVTITENSIGSICSPFHRNVQTP
jgi:hypothetical protein